MSDKTQREQDEAVAHLSDATQTVIADLEAAKASGFEDPRLQHAYMTGCAHGRRDSDAWRAAMNYVVAFLTLRSCEHGMSMMQGTERLLEGYADHFRELAGTEPPRTYEDGLREAARLVRKEADQYADSEIGRQKAITARYIASCIESLAASTPPATPSAGKAPCTCNAGKLYDAAHDTTCPRFAAATPPEQTRSAVPPLTYAEGKRDAARRVNDAIAEAGRVDSAWAGIAAVRLGPLLSELASLDEGAAPPGDARRLLANVLAKRRTLENATSHEIGNAVEDLGEAEAEAYAFLASTPEAPRTAADGYAECERDVMAMLDAIVARNTKWGDKADSILEARVCLSKDNHVGAFERARAAARAKGGG